MKRQALREFLLKGWQIIVLEKEEEKEKKKESI